MLILDSLAPIFLLIALGAILRRSRMFPPEFFRGLNRLVFLFALPALLVARISTAPLQAESILRIVLLFTAATLGGLGVAWGAARRLRLPPPRAGAFIQGAFRGNGAFIGLPVILYTVGERDPRAAALGTVVLAPLVIIFNVLAVAVLLHYGRPAEKRHTFRDFLLNPLILSCIAGLALNLSGISLPRLILRPLNLLGNASLPLVLMSIGASLEFERLKGAASPSVIASLIKVLIIPLLGLALSPLFVSDPAERAVALFYLACPSATMSYVMAEVMGCDAVLAGRIVVLSTLLSALTLPLVILLTA